MPQKPLTPWTILTELWRLTDERNLGLIAAGVAFYAMFALFPALGAVVSIWSWLADPAALQSYLDVADGFIPPEAFGLIRGQVEALVRTSGEQVGWRTGLSLAVAMWSTRAGLASVVQGLNTIYESPSRGGLRQVAVAMGLTLAVLGMAIAGLMTVVVVPILLAFLPLGPAEGRIVAGLPWAATFLLLLATLGLVYRFGPNTGSEHRAGWITPGAGLAALLWAAASLAFSLYLANFGSYNRVYGSLGAVVALLMWFYLSAYAVLLGAALNRVLGIPRPPEPAAAEPEA